MNVKLHIKKGDLVKVIAGTSKGSEGTILSIDRKKSRAIVVGKDIRMNSIHTKPSTQNPDGGIVKKEAPIHISNLMVIDGKGNPTKTGRMKNAEGKSVRFSKKTKEEIK